MKEQNQLVFPHLSSGSTVNQVAIRKPNGDISDVKPAVGPPVAKLAPVVSLLPKEPVSVPIVKAQSQSLSGDTDQAAGGSNDTTVLV